MAKSPHSFGAFEFDREWDGHKCELWTNGIRYLVRKTGLEWWIPFSAVHQIHGQPTTRIEGVFDDHNEAYFQPVVITLKKGDPLLLPRVHFKVLLGAAGILNSYNLTHCWYCNSPNVDSQMELEFRKLVGEDVTKLSLA